MKKFLIILMFSVMLVGCDRYVPVSLMDKSVDICAQNDGVAYIITEGINIVTTKTTAIVMCNNKAKFHLWQKGSRVLSPFVVK